MAVPLSQFVSEDEYIVKQPRAAITNSQDTLPALTRPLAQSPVYPPPNNIGEIGTYPNSSGDTTPVGDERTGTNPPPDYAVEYMVYVSDEGTGVNVSSEETFEAIDGWVAYEGGSNITLTSRDPQQGSRSLRFTKAAGNLQGGVEKAVVADYSAYDPADFFLNLYLPAFVLGMVDFRFELEDNSGNKRIWSVALGSLTTSAWNTLTFDADAPNEQDDAGFDSSSVRFVRFYATVSSTLSVISGVEIDDFKGTDLLTGKISSGTVEVSFARNSAWQTKFEYNQALNRWVLISRELGVISNTTRLTLPSEYINDLSNRPIDFDVDVAGASLTVSTVADESAFGTPAAGTCEFARAEGTFHFSVDDLATYAGKTVSYTEVADGTATVNSAGVATLERSLTITFQANNDQTKKDLSLDYALVDEVISSELSGTKEIPLTFVPQTGTITLNYSPVPDGYNDPLVEGTDFIVDADAPSFKFTSTATNELLANDAPSSPGDLHTGRRRYDILPLRNSDVVSGTLSLTEDSVTQTEDEDYVVDLESGNVLLTYGLREEVLLGNVFVSDPGFVAIDVSLYVNGVEVLEYTLVPQAGWINLDSPLFEGDTITFDYVTDASGLEGTSIVGEELLTPSVVVPSLSSTAQRTITATNPASGGEINFSVQNPPVRLSRVEIDEGVTSLTLDGDRTADYVAGVVLLLQEDHYLTSSSSYDAGTDKTTVVVAEATRQSYVNPTTFYTQAAVGWTSEATTHPNTPNGVNTITLVGGAARVDDYYEGILVRLRGSEVYLVQGSSVSGADAIITLTKPMSFALRSTDTIEYTAVAIPTEGDTEFRLFYSPILDVPDAFEPNGDLKTLDSRFSGIGGRSVRVIRNGSDLTQDVDYSVDTSGVVTLFSAVADTDTSIVVRYLPTRLSTPGSTVRATYTYFSNSPAGVGLRGSLQYQVPDTFYFRVVSNNTQADIYSDILEAQIRQKAGQVTGGSSPSIPSSVANHEQGVETPVGRVGDLYDNDFVAQRIYDFYTTRIGYLEAEKMELSGEVPGGYGGPLTQAELEESAYDTGRLFPIDPVITQRILTIGRDKALPARPYRLPVLFGLSREDDGTRVVMDSDYPKIPVVSFPPFPPQGRTYKGSNQEPTAFGVLGVFSLEYSASAPTTFVENWYPDFLDPSTSGYTNYAVSPATVTTSVLDVRQDTGDPNTSTPVFPPADLELDPADYEGFDTSSFPLTTYTSVAPRDTTEVPPSYEGAAIGALQGIDDAIEASTLAGTPHRQVAGDPTTYPDFLGWTYRDYNEYDLLTNGTTPETTLLQAEWVSGARPADLSALTTNAQRQLLCLNIQKESLTRQKSFLDSLQTQLDPVPTGDPEATTISEAAAAELLVDAALVDVQAALNNLQEWYDDVIVTASGAATDDQIRTRWEFITGVDVSAVTPPTALPTTPVTLDSRILQVEARISDIVDRLGEINSSLGFDDTLTPDFSSVDTSEDLYTNRFTYVDLRVNRESGTLFNALSRHAQYVRDVAESTTLRSVLSLLRG